MVVAGTPLLSGWNPLTGELLWKAELLGGCAENIVTVDLPHVPPKEVGPDEAYAAAAETLDRWKTAGVIRQEDGPAR